MTVQEFEKQSVRVRRFDQVGCEIDDIDKMICAISMGEVVRCVGKSGNPVRIPADLATDVLQTIKASLFAERDAL